MIQAIATIPGTPILPPLLKLPAPIGVSLRLERTKGPKMRLTIVNRSDRTVFGHQYAFDDHNRAFARALSGGPILTEPDWSKGLREPKIYAA